MTDAKTKKAKPTRYKFNFALLIDKTMSKATKNKKTCTCTQCQNRCKVF